MSELIHKSDSIYPFLPGLSAEQKKEFFDELVDDNVFYLYLKHRKPNTLKHYQYAIGKFSDFVYFKIGEDLSLYNEPSDWKFVGYGYVTVFIEGLYKEGDSLRTINRILSAIKVYAGLAFISGYLSEADEHKISKIQPYRLANERTYNEERIINGFPIRKSNKKTPLSL